MAAKTLTAVLPELRRPFTAAAIKMKPQTVTKDKTKGLVTYYIDSRLVVERLNAAVGPECWADEYKLLCEGALAPGVGIPVECSLTVLGVMKADVGQIAPGQPDDKAWKSAYSDAFKRAGVKFSIGAYLYGGANVWAPVQVGQDGKVRGFSHEGIAYARRMYADWIALPRMVELYGEPVDHGDAEPDAPEPTPEPGPEPANGNGEASIKQKGEIAALIGTLSKLRKTSVAKINTALTTDYGRLEDLSGERADELIAKLKNWEKNSKKEAAAA